MYPVAPSQTGSRQDERRRNPRLKAPSIIYAQLGSDNGGIVVNLGIDGVACHAAQKLTAEKKSTLNLRLRGSGLNADLVGELVWLGATQKEVGISFKNLSASVQQNLADWIAREAQGNGAALEEPSRPKQMPAMPGVPTTVKDAVPHSLSAALAMSKSMSSNPASGEDADKSLFAALPDPVDEVSGAALRTAIASPIPQDDGPAVALDGQARASSAGSSVAPEPPPAEQPLQNQIVSAPPAVEQGDQSAVHVPSPSVLPDAPPIPVRKELAQAPADLAAKCDPSKTGAVRPRPRRRKFDWPDRWLESAASEKWIPPALLVAWRQGNRQRKFLLVGSAAACMGIFALTIILSVAYIGSSFSRSAEGQLPQQRAAQQSALRQPVATPPSARASLETPQPGSLPVASVLPAAAPPRPRRPEPSLIASFAKSVFGYDPDPSDPNAQIDADQLRRRVWTSKSSGYYYCTDDAFYKTVQPGAFMTQADALQSGYRPILGQFCN